jgi:citrate lyase subunit beta/citryl-CoA lyase
MTSELRRDPILPAWLFCPADRPDRFGKAAAVADVVILDLEDAVGPAAKPQARANLSAAADQLDPSRTVIRLNAATTDDYGPDVEAVAGSPFRTVMLAKAESAAQVDALGELAVIALCETPRGIRAVDDIVAAENCVGIMWGAEDLLAALGGTSSRNEAGAYRGVAAHARSEVLLAAAAAGRAALDSVYLNIPDLAGLEAEALDAAGSGFSAKVCIHPTQTAIVRRAFGSTPEQVSWATRVLEAATEHPHGVFRLDGQMVDGPVLLHARRILANR